MSEPENGEEARRMRAVGDEQPDVPAPRAVVEHVLDRFNLTLARLDGGSNAGAYVAVPPWLVMLAMTVLDPVGEQRDYYDVYGFEDQVENDGDVEVQIFGGFTRSRAASPWRSGRCSSPTPKAAALIGPVVATALCPSSSHRTSAETCTG